MNPWIYLPIVIGSGALSAVLVRLSIKLSYRWNSLDKPDGGRKTQHVAVPRLGGVGVVLAFSATLMVVAGLSGQRSALPLLVGVILPALFMAAIGLLDDWRPLSPWLRLVGQAAVASLTWFLGTRIDIASAELVNFGLFVLWIVAIVNAVNMLDNSDGLAGAISFVIGVAAGVIAILLGQYLVAALAWALAGVCGGFLWHNWYPAKVYLGDTGAYFLGFMLAILTVRLRPADLGSEWALVIPILLLAVPLSDLAFVVVRRIARGVHPFTAGRDHLSHVLQQRGLSVPQAVGALLFATVGSTSLAVAVVLLS